MGSKSEAILKGKNHDDEDGKKGESEIEASSSFWSSTSSEDEEKEEEEEKECQKTDLKSLCASPLLNVGNVPPDSSHPFYHDFRAPIDNDVVVDGLLKELMLHKLNGKDSFSMLNNKNHVDDKNPRTQVPTGKTKKLRTY